MQLSKDKILFCLFGILGFGFGFGFIVVFVWFLVCLFVCVGFF